MANTLGYLCCSYNRLQLVILWWGIGQHIGRVLPINKYGHLVNHLHQVISGDGVLPPHHADSRVCFLVYMLHGQFGC
jgi:hypothetical protein